jgi:thiamine pyrophosphate-dependent acetolactate synthase large subunit-like protein
VAAHRLEHADAIGDAVRAALASGGPTLIEVPTAP